MFKILTLLATLFFIGCAATVEERNEVQKLDTKMKKTQSIAGDEKVGVKDDKMVIQKKVRLGEELRRIENETYGLEYDVYGNRQYGTIGLYGAYSDCLAELNALKLGGDGKVQPIEPAAPVIKEDPFFKYGTDETGELVAVSEEFLTERIDRFKKYKDILEKRHQEYTLKNKICENNLKNAKYKARQEKKKSKEE